MWDAAVVDHGTAMSQAREAALKRLTPYLGALFERFSGLEVSVGLQPGWTQEHPLAEALRLGVDRDRERGSTTVGPHRADVVLRLKGRSARETASRGQQKLIAVSMIVGQMKLLKAELGIHAVLLLDDPAAELDTQNLGLLFAELASLDCQMIATSLSPEITLFQAPKAMFHVEQGRVIRL